MARAVASVSPAIAVLGSPRSIGLDPVATTVVTFVLLVGILLLLRDVVRFSLGFSAPRNAVASDQRLIAMAAILAVCCGLLVGGAFPF